MKPHSFHVLVVIIDVMLSTCTPPTSVVKVMGLNLVIVIMPWWAEPWSIHAVA